MLSHLHLWTNIGLLKSMYSKRYYEFKRHARKHIILLLITQACIYYLLVATLLNCFVIYCNNFDEYVLGPDVHFQEKSICAYVEQNSGKLTEYTTFSMLRYLSITICNVTPVLAFFCL